MKAIHFSLFAIIFSLFTSVALASCKGLKVDYHHDEPTVSQRRALTGFERIELLGSLDVKYQQADSFSVFVDAPADVLKYVETRVEGNRLIVNIKGEGKIINFGVKDADDVTVYVTSPDFLGIELKGSGDFDCKGHLDTDNLNIQLKGSGDIEFQDVICDHVAVSVVGSGDVEVKNIVSRETDIQLVGSGDIKMNQRQVARTDMELKGSGDISLMLQQCGTVNARVLGSGDITLRGDVDKLNQQTRGSGDIHTKQLVIRNS